MTALNRWSLRIALALILLGAGLRLYRLENKNIWWDEGYTVFMARLPVATMLDATAHDTHPPLYYGLLHGWMALAGDSEFALRLPSALAGVLAIPIVLRLVRRLAGTRAAWLAAALVALSRVLIWYSQEVRQYAFATLLALASLALAHALWRGRRLAWLAYIAVTLAGLLSLYLFVGIVIAQNLAAAVAVLRAGATRHTFNQALKWVSAQGLIALGCVPWIVYYLPRAPHHFSVVTPLALTEVGKLYLNAVLVGDATNIDRFWPFVLVCLALAAGGALAGRPGGGQRSPALAFGVAGLVGGAAVLPLLVWLVNQPSQYQLSFVPSSRYFLLAVPSALALIGILLAKLTHRWARAGWVAAAVILAGFGWYSANYYLDRHRTDDYAGAAATVAAYRQPDDAVFLANDTDWPTIAYHLGRYPQGTQWIGLNSGRPIISEADAATALAANWNTHAGAWLLLTSDALINDPERHLVSWLTARALATRVFEYQPATELMFFARTPERAANIDQLAGANPPPATLSFSPAPGLTLAQAAWTLPEYHTGESVHVFLRWHNAQAPGTYAFAVRLNGRDGTLAEEIPATLTVDPAAPEWLRQQIDFPLRAYVGSGQYQFVLVAGQKWAGLGSLNVAAASPAPAQSGPEQANPAQFEGGLRLLGYTPRLTSRTLALTLFWTTAEPIDHPYKLFAHLLGPATNPATGNASWAQWDSLPGTDLITSWRTDSTLTTQVELTPPANRPPGQYQVEVGWYDGLTGERLMVLDATGQPADSRAVLRPFDWPQEP